jgi:hypothetical protein
MSFRSGHKARRALSVARFTTPLLGHLLANVIPKVAVDRISKMLDRIKKGLGFIFHEVTSARRGAWNWRTSGRKGIPVLWRKRHKREVEENVLAKIESEFSRTVGGFMQKLEVYPTGDRAVVAYTWESRSKHSQQSSSCRAGLALCAGRRTDGPKPALMAERRPTNAGQFSSAHAVSPQRLTPRHCFDNKPSQQ